MRFPLRRVVLGFAAGAAAGWAASLLRSPSGAPAGSSADAATRLPQEEFGEPVNDPEQVAEIAQEPTAPPRKATAPSVKPIPGSDAEPAEAGGSEPATGPEVGAEQLADAPAEPAVEDAAPADETQAPAGEDAGTPAEAVATKRVRAAKPRRPRAPAPDPAADAAEALREGHAAATEALTDLEPPAPPPVRRRRPPAKG